MRSLVLLLVLKSAAAFGNADFPDLSTPEDRAAAEAAADKIKQQKKFELPACKAFEKSMAASLPETPNEECDGDGTPRTISQLAAVSFKAVRDQMLSDFRDHLLKKVESNLNVNGALIQCFSGGKPPAGVIEKDDCNAAVAKAKQQTAELLPKMRLNLALAMPPDRVADSSQLPPEQYRDTQKFRSSIAHSYLGSSIPPLTSKEKQYAAAYFNQDSANLRNQAREKLAQTHSCIKKTGDKWDYEDDKCRLMVDAARAESREIFLARNNRRASYYQNNYDQILGQAPHLGFLNTSDPNDPKLNDKLKSAFAQLQSRTQKEADNLKNMKGSDLDYLVIFKPELDAYLKNMKPPAPRAYCDVAQSLINRTDNEELITRVGVGAIALVGSGLCLYTAGLGCAGATAVRAAVAGVVASEGVALARAQSAYSEAAQRFYAGTGSLDEVKAAQSERNMEVALAPTALIGTGVGGQLMGKAVIAARAQAAARNELAETWTRSLSKPAQEKLTSRLASDAGIKAGHQEIIASMNNLAKAQAEHVPVALQDKFMTNVNKAIANLGKNEMLNTGFYKQLIDNAAKAKPGTAAAARAVRELDNHSTILRYVNSQSGNTFKERVERFMATVSLKMKRISPAEAQIYTGCIVDAKAAASNARVKRAIAACWKTPPQT